MKSNLTPLELIERIKDYRDRAQDFRISPGLIQATYHTPQDDDGNPLTPTPLIEIEQGDETYSYGITNHAHSQLANAMNVPAQYIKHISQSHPDLWCETFNTFLEEDRKDRTIRTMLHSSDEQGHLSHGDIRAILGANYAIRDNDQILAKLQPVFEDPSVIDGDYEVHSADLTYDQLYFKIATPRLTGEVERGDVVQGGIVISNSETGKGSTKIERFIYRLVCKNGMIRPETSQSYRHVGKRLIMNEDKFQVLSRDTLEQSDAAFYSALADVVRHLLKPAAFAEDLAAMQRANGREMNPQFQTPKFIERIGKRLDLTNEEQDAVLDNLVKAPKQNQWQLVNAVTAVANNISNYERATYLESAGSQVLQYGDSEWSKLITV